MSPRLSHKKRAMDILAAIHWTAGDVERHVRRVSFDWLGFGDVVAVRADMPGVLVLQVTDPTNVAARVKKCLQNEHVRTVLAAGNRVEVWGVRDNDEVKGRTIVWDDGRLRVIKGSMVLESET